MRVTTINTPEGEQTLVGVRVWIRSDEEFSLVITLPGCTAATFDPKTVQGVAVFTNIHTAAVAEEQLREMRKPVRKNPYKDEIRSMAYEYGKQAGQRPPWSEIQGDLQSRGVHGSELAAAKKAYIRGRADRLRSQPVNKPLRRLVGQDHSPDQGGSMKDPLTRDERSMLIEARQHVQAMRTTLVRITYLARRIPGPQGWGEGTVRWNEQPFAKSREVIAKMLKGWHPEQPAVAPLTPLLTAVQDAVRELEVGLALLHNGDSP